MSAAKDRLFEEMEAAAAGSCDWCGRALGDPDCYCSDLDKES